MIRSLIATLLVFSFYAAADDLSLLAAVPVTPDPEITVGDFCDPSDPDFQEYRYAEKVPTCVRYVSQGRKKRIYDQYGIPEHCRKHFTVDHYIPLFMGGSNRPENLWPEHRDIKATRQNLEQNLYNQLNAGQISQERALRTITHAKHNPPHVVPKGCN